MELEAYAHSKISIHALREEGDASAALGDNRPKIFLSTPSARRATRQKQRRPKSEQFLSTPSARRATFALIAMGVDIIKFLSTPSARRATSMAYRCVSNWRISIHALREEGDDCTDSGVSGRYAFLSTPSARRATAGGNAKHHAEGNFYPRPPRGGRPWAFFAIAVAVFISIHALREEGDVIQCHLYKIT